MHSTVIFPLGMYSSQVRDLRLTYIRPCANKLVSGPISELFLHPHGWKLLRKVIALRRGGVGGRRAAGGEEEVWSSGSW